ncbi:MAG: hypothetical protein R3B69_00570 [Candidatus Paceibacterota bacterium]
MEIEEQKMHTPTPHRAKHRRTVIMIIVLFVLLVGGMFMFTFLKQQELHDSQTPTTDTPVGEDDAYASITRIDGKHFYIDGVHTVVGEVSLPTPCDLLEVEAFVAESYPEQITLDFSVVNNADTCIQVVTAQRFKVEVAASEEATFSALFQNRVVELNLTPAAPGETPEDFELFIKG